MCTWLHLYDLDRDFMTFIGYFDTDILKVYQSTKNEVSKLDQTDTQTNTDARHYHASLAGCNNVYYPAMRCHFR